MAVEGFLGRVLMDPATGLPNFPYFCLIQEWEERRARRRNYVVRVINVHVEGGDERTRRSLSWRLCQEIRTSDLIGSEGRDNYRILLTSPDAENADAICRRVEMIGQNLTDEHPGAEPVTITVTMEPIREADISRGPCDPCDDSVLGES
jgi:hypothetical protein